MENRNSVIRLSKYKNAIIRLKKLGFKKVFSTNIADVSGTTSIQLRKDFSIFGIVGKKRGGYVVDDLLDDINRILGKDAVINVVVAGVGKLGSALMHYSGFENESIKIIAGFDIDPGKYDETLVPPVLPLSEMRKFIIENNVELGMITTNLESAPQICEMMVNAGIKGILNFAPLVLKKYDSCVVLNINIVTHLENLIYFVKLNEANNERND